MMHFYGNRCLMEMLISKYNISMLLSLYICKYETSFQYFAILSEKSGEDTALCADQGCANE